jgi:UDP-2,3-diacylglucosamine pyrophosphatase LpxH
MATDKDVSWWDNHTLYKQTVIGIKRKLTGHPFVMYYNANGDSVNKKRGAERIGMAVSDDMLTLARYGKDPVLNHGDGITGDPYMQKIGNVWVMFYFGAFWKEAHRVRSTASPARTIWCTGPIGPAKTSSNRPSLMIICLPTNHLW